MSKIPMDLDQCFKNRPSWVIPDLTESTFCHFFFFFFSFFSFSFSTQIPLPFPLLDLGLGFGLMGFEFGFRVLVDLSLGFVMEVRFWI